MSYLPLNMAAVKDGPVCIVETTKNSKVRTYRMSLETVINFMVNVRPNLESLALCRECVLSGGQYETNICDTIFRVRLVNDD